MYFDIVVCFEILYQLPVFYPRGPVGALPGPKNQIFVKFQKLPNQKIQF